MPSLRLRIRRKRKRLMFLTARTLVRCAGFARVRGLGRFLGDLQYLFSPRGRTQQLRDVAAVLGEPGVDARVKSTLREAYRVNTAAVLEILAMFDRRQDSVLSDSRCELDGIEHLQEALAKGRGAILLPSHAGNGAALAVRLANQGRPVSVVYKQSRMMTAGFFERGFTLYGIDGILANEGIKAYGKMLGALRKGRILFVMLDQGTKLSQDGVMLRFLGKDMPISAGPAQLARHSGAPVLPVATVSADPAWRFRIDAPLVRVSGASLEADTEQLARVTESLILQQPQLWSWQHRRWRNFPLAPEVAGRASGGPAR